MTRTSTEVGIERKKADPASHSLVWSHCYSRELPERYTRNPRRHRIDSSAQAYAAATRHQKTGPGRAESP
eukprot:7037118-Prymnesium_polylepis.1